jgi:hypothetical protein
VGEFQPSDADAQQNRFGQLAQNWEQAAQDEAARQRANAIHSSERAAESQHAQNAMRAQLANANIFDIKEQEWLKTQTPRERLRRERMEQLFYDPPEVSLRQGEDPEVIFDENGAAVCRDFLDFMRQYDYPNTVPILGAESKKPDFFSSLGNLVLGLKLETKPEVQSRQQTRGFRSMTSLMEVVRERYDTDYENLIGKVFAYRGWQLETHPENLLNWVEFSRGYILPPTSDQKSQAFCLGIDGKIHALFKRRNLTSNVLELPEAKAIVPYINLEPVDVGQPGTYKKPAIRMTGTGSAPTGRQEYDSKYPETETVYINEVFTPEEGRRKQQELDREWQRWGSRNPMKFEPTSVDESYPDFKNYLAQLAKATWKSGRRS